MSVFVESGSYQKTKVGNGDSDVISLTRNPTGVPVFVLLRMTNSIATGQADRDGAFGIGMSDGTNEITMSTVQQDNVPTTQDISISTENGGNLINNAGGSLVINIGTLVAGAFTITYTTNISTQVHISWMVVGGADITNTNGGFADHTVVTTPDIDVSFTGVGFQPDMIFFFDPFLSLAHGLWSVGVAASSAKQGALIGFGRDNLPTSNEYSLVRTDTCNAQPSWDGGANPIYLRRNEFKQFDADGWTWIQRQGSNGARVFGYFAIKGGLWDVTPATVRTSAGSQTIETTVRPKGILTLSAGKVASNLYTPEHHYSIGGSDGTEQSCLMGGAEHNAATTITGVSFNDAAILELAANLNAGAGPTLSSVNTLTSFGLTGLTVNQAVGDSAEKEFLVVAVGDTGSGAGADRPSSLIGGNMLG